MRSADSPGTVNSNARGKGFSQLMDVAARMREGNPAPQQLALVNPPMNQPILAFGATDVGRRRRNNEDAYLIDERLGAYLVADGMGGANGGEVASQMAVCGVQEALLAREAGLHAAENSRNAAEHPLCEILPLAVRQANRKIHARAEVEPGLHGMGTTLTGLIFDRDLVFLAHVGDSRAYRIRGERIEQISSDHTYVNEMIKAGAMDPAKAESVPWKHVLMRAVGVERDVKVDMRAFGTRPGDIFVLCSDGLANVVSTEEIRSTVLAGILQGAPDRLVKLANTRGGPDNITTVVMCVNERQANDEEHPPAASKIYSH